MPGGRPRKPTALKLIEGTFRKDRANPEEPQPDLVSGMPAPPRKLKAEAMREWNRVAGELSKMRVLAVDELSVLATYCNLHAAIVKAENRDELLPAGYYAQYRGLIDSFGLTPSSRAKVRVPKKQTTKNEWSDLANG
jgi:phage terminase small subunit